MRKTVLSSIIIACLTSGAPAQAGDKNQPSGQAESPKKGEGARSAPGAATPDPMAIYNYIVGYQLAMRARQKLAQAGIELSPEAYGEGIADSLAGKAPKYEQDTVVAAIQAIQAAQTARQDAAKTKNRTDGDAFLAENAKKPNVKVLPSGLQYIESQAGKGQTPSAGSTVVVHYRGTLINGEEFDSSYSRGQPARFSPGGVIPGFREALLNMQVGSKWRVFIPSQLGYGEQGAGGKIGPNQTLIFDLELLEIDPE